MRLFKLLSMALCLLILLPVKGQAQSIDYGCLQLYPSYSNRVTNEKFYFPVSILDLTSGEQRNFFADGKDTGRIYASPDQKHLALQPPSESGKAHTYDLLMQPAKIDAKPTIVREQLPDDLEMLWSPDGKWLIYYWSEQTEDTEDKRKSEVIVAIADTTGNELTYRQLELNANAEITNVSWSPDSKYLITESHAYYAEPSDWDIALWQMPNLALLRTFRLSDKRDIETTWSPNSNYVTLVDWRSDTEHQLSILDIDEGSVPRLLTRSLDYYIAGPEDGYPLFGWTADGRYLTYSEVTNAFTDDIVTQIKVHDTRSNTTRALFEPQKKFTFEHAFNDRGYVGVYWIADDKLYASAINVRTGKELALPPLDAPADGYINELNLNWNNSGNVLSLLGTDGFSLANVDTGTAFFFPHLVIPDWYFVSKNGEYVVAYVVSDTDDRTWLYNTRTGQSTVLIDDILGGADFSPDGTAVALYGVANTDSDGIATLGGEVAYAPLQRDEHWEIRQVHWSPDSKYLIVLYDKGLGEWMNAALYDRDGKLLREFPKVAEPYTLGMDRVDWIACNP